MVASGSAAEFARTQALAEAALLNQGVTFSVYSDARGVEKIFPVCLLPRVISAAEWERLERGLEQRVRALEAFVDDVYAEQRILRAGSIPAEVVLGSAQYLPALRGVRPPDGRAHPHLGHRPHPRRQTGIFRVLEDNLRTPSGVSYVLENRLLSKRLLARAFEAARVRPVNQYPARLATRAAQRLAGAAPEETTVVVLTPGPLQLGLLRAQLPRPPDGRGAGGGGGPLRRRRSALPAHHPRTEAGRTSSTDAPTTPSSIPEVFRPDSMLGVRGLMRAWAKGNVALANAPGNGVADDKGVYPFVPEMVRFYLGEEPLLAQVPTYQCARPDDRAYVLEHLGELVVKVVDEAGGYGMLMGPTSTAEEREEFRRRILAAPRRYIAQPRIELSTCPTWVSQGQCIAPRRVDFRPYVLNSADGPWVLPGGLTRVALREGSYVVNSSQGGGSKDTWVLKGDG